MPCLWAHRHSKNFLNRNMWRKHWTSKWKLTTICVDLKAMGEEYVILTNPRNTQSGINRYPERLPYGNSAVIGNPDVKEAYGDGSYIYSEKTWINGGK